MKNIFSKIINFIRKINREYKIDFEIKPEVKELYDYLQQCDDELKIHEQQFLHLKELAIVAKYLGYINNQEIIDIYHKAKYYWQTLDSEVNLDELKELAWELNDKLFGIHINSIDAIILRFLLGSTYNNNDKDFFDNSFEFDDYLIKEAEKLGYKQFNC